MQGLDYDYEMFATEAGRGVFATADLDGDGRIDIAGFSKIVHVRHHSPPHTLSVVQHSKARTSQRSHANIACQHAAFTPNAAAPRANHLSRLACLAHLKVYKLLHSYTIEGGGGVDRVENAQQQAEKARETLQQNGPNHARRLQQTIRRAV